MRLLAAALILMASLAPLRAETLAGDRVLVVHPPEAAHLARQVIDKTLVVRPRLEREFAVELPRQRIELVRGHAALQAMAGGPVPQWALAVALPRQDRIGIRIDRLELLRNSLAGTLKHELMHLALGRIEARAGYPLPRWFNEGLCEWYSGVMHHQARRALTFDAATGGLIPFRELQSEFPAEDERATRAYLQSHAFVEHLAAAHPGCLQRALHSFAAGRPFDEALAAATGQPLETLEAQWRRAVTPRHPWLWLLWDGLTLFGALGLLVVVAYGLQKLRDRRTHARWAEDDPWDAPGFYDEESDWRGRYDP